VIITGIAYVVTLSTVYFAITLIPQTSIARIISRVIRSPLLCAYFGSIITWSFINFLWKVLEGGPMPIAVLISAIALLFLQGIIGRNELNATAKLTMAAEVCAIITCGIYLVVDYSPIRWF
jgi:hypothetical protein